MGRREELEPMKMPEVPVEDLKPIVSRRGRLAVPHGLGGAPYLSGLAPLLPLVIVCAVGGLVIRGFFSRENIDSILVLASFLGIAAAGQTMVIILGGIDLSIASCIGLAEVAVSVLESQGIPLWRILLILIASGTVIGVMNGGISSIFRVNPLIVTLGMGFMISGGVLTWTSGGATQGISPQIFQEMTAVYSTIGPVPAPPIVLVWAIVTAVMLIVQKQTALGKEIYALGSNARAAELALVPRYLVWMSAYIISAMSALLAGVLLSGFSGGANFSVGDQYLFNSVAAVVVGGTSLLGGSGGYERTVIGTLVVIVITTILIGIGLDASFQEALLGVFIVLVVALTGRQPHIRTRV
jgi:ribose transport system permease protein